MIHFCGFELITVKHDTHERGYNAVITNVSTITNNKRPVPSMFVITEFDCTFFIFNEFFQQNMFNN